VAITASTAGQDSNENAGVTLSFVSPIAGVDSDTTVDSGGLTGGTDEETDDALRVRILSRKRFAPHGGAAQDYINWAKEVSGVTRAWVYEQYYGVGTLALFFVRDNDTDIFPDAAEITEVEDYLEGHEDADGRTVGIPVTAEPGLFVLAPTRKDVNFQIGLAPNTAAVQAAVQAELEDLFYREGGPGQTIYLSQISEAIGGAAGETHHRIISPVADVVAAYNELPMVGTITWSDY
jgi:uncharacterized phage protein gp47/JayE